MVTRSFDQILDECLRMLQAGAGIDDCLAPYPEHADELRARLWAAQTVLNARPSVQPDPLAQGQGRARLLVAVEEYRQTAEAQPALGLVAPLRAILGGARSRLVLLPQALPAVLAMLVLGGAAWGVAAATGNSNPGGWFAGNSSREERIELRGTIVAIDPSALTVATPSGEATVQINEQTEFEDADKAPLALADFAPGDSVKVSAFRDAAGTLIAREVERESQEPDIGRPDDGDQSGPGSPNSGPGNAEDGEENNSGPGNAEETPDDNEEDNFGPGNAEDDEEEDHDSSGPGSGGGDDEERDGSGRSGGEEEDD